MASCAEAQACKSYASQRTFFSASLSLLLGCKAPDLYAGVAAIAGPSVGSDQMLATTPWAQALEDTPQKGTAKCLELAGDKRIHFQTQVSNIAYGTMDLNGNDGHFAPCMFTDEAAKTWFCSKEKHPGQYELVSVKWAQYNTEILRSVYGSGTLTQKNNLNGDQAVENISTDREHAPLALLAIRKVGHAWPAGTGQANGPGGDWIAQSSLNYPNYIINWMLKHNRRAQAM